MRVSVPYCFFKLYCCFFKLYCCFTAALLLLYFCLPAALEDEHATRVSVPTAALLLLYC
jgi:hypothetical protein